MVTAYRISATRRRGSEVWPLLAVLAITSSACATGGVPRPFPGAALPPGTGASPTTPVDAPPARAGVPDESAPAAEPPASVVATALGFQGVPYVSGGTSPSGFDCSGLVQYVFAQHGTALPREVRDQYRAGRRVDVMDVLPGDLVFFRTVRRGASHVGVAIGDGQFVHAPSSRGVVHVARYDASYWASRFVGARRVVDASLAAHQGPPGTAPSTH